jgi:hypothetical protein
MSAHRCVRARVVAFTGGLLAAALALAACAAGGSSSSEQEPVGPSPAVTVIIHVGGSDGSSVELVGLGTDPVELERATSDIAALVAGGASNVGTVAPGVSSIAAGTGAGQDPVLSTTAPISVSDQAFTIELRSDAIGQALADIRPRSTAVWVCTDRSRTVQVNSQAPGAVSTDVASGTCQSAGSSLWRDGVTWTASAAIGPVTGPSKLPWLIGILVVIAAVVGAIAYIRARRDASDPLLPPVH